MDKCFKLCLKAGAQINLVNDRGHNVLTEEDQSKDVAMLLFATGERLSTLKYKNYDGSTAKVPVPEYF